jgi:hypothetical protein
MVCTDSQFVRGTVGLRKEIELKHAEIEAGAAALLAVEADLRRLGVCSPFECEIC